MKKHLIKRYNSNAKKLANKFTVWELKRNLVLYVVQIPFGVFLATVNFLDKKVIGVLFMAITIVAVEQIVIIRKAIKDKENHDEG